MLKLSCDRAEQINTFLLHKHCSMTPAPRSRLSPVPGVAIARAARGPAARHTVRVLVAAPGPGPQVTPVIQKSTTAS